MQKRYTNLQLNFIMENVRFRIIQIAIEHSTKFHMHAHGYNCYELHYVIKGSGKVVIDRTEYLVSEGMFYMTGPEIFHKQIPDVSNPMSEYCMFLYADTLSSTEEKVTSVFLNTLSWIGKDTQNIAEIFDRMILEIENRDIGNDLFLSALLQTLIIKCVRNYSTDFKGDIRRKDETLFDRRDIIIEEAFIYNGAMITLNTLAKELSLSERQTERYIIKRYGKSFSMKKQESKMLMAESMLLETNKPMTALALQLGYSSSQHFSNAFKKHSGLAPSYYRRLNS